MVGYVIRNCPDCAAIGGPCQLCYGSGKIGIVPWPRPEAASGSVTISAEAELKQITPSNAELLKLAERLPAPQEWYDEQPKELTEAK